jgi:hypothetical protein
MREVDVAVFSPVAGGVGGGLAKLSGGVVCNDCCALMIGFSVIVMDARCWTSYTQQTGGCILLFAIVVRASARSRRTLPGRWNKVLPFQTCGLRTSAQTNHHPFNPDKVLDSLQLQTIQKSEQQVAPIALPTENERGLPQAAQLVTPTTSESLTSLRKKIDENLVGDGELGTGDAFPQSHAGSCMCIRVSLKMVGRTTGSLAIPAL